MKKRFVFVLFFVLICLSSFALAANSTINISSYSGNVLTSQVSVPENLQIPARILFGLNGAEINLQELVVLIVLWVIALLIVREVVSFLIGYNWKSFGVAIIVACLISVSGALRDMMYYLVGVIGRSIIYWVVALFALAIICAVILAFLKLLRKEANILANEEAGMKVGSK